LERRRYVIGREEGSGGGGDGTGDALSSVDFAFESVRRLRLQDRSRRLHGGVESVGGSYGAGTKGLGSLLTLIELRRDEWSITLLLLLTERRSGVEGRLLMLMLEMLLKRKRKGLSRCWSWRRVGRELESDRLLDSVLKSDAGDGVLRFTTSLEPAVDVERLVVGRGDVEAENGSKESTCTSTESASESREERWDRDVL
jgi:hypothetical protein